MPIRRLTGLKGLQGLKGLSDSDREKWMEEQRKAGKINDRTSWDYMDRLYRNQAYVDKYGMEDFKRRTAAERDLIYGRDLALEDANNNYNPFKKVNPFDASFIGRFKKGLHTNLQELIPAQYNAIQNNSLEIDPDKGAGDADTWRKIQTLAENDPELYFELKDSGWVPRRQLEKKLTKLNEKDKDDNTNVSSTTLQVLPGILNPLLSFLPGGLGNEMMTGAAIEANDDKLAKVYGKYLDKQRDVIAKDKNLLADEYLNQGEEAVKSKFLKLIRETNPSLAVYYDKDGNPDDEVADFDVRDMANYIAEYQLLSQRMGEEDARLAMSNFADSYVHDNQGWWTRQGLHTKEFLLKVGSYSAAKVTGLYQRYAQAVDDKANVYVDAKGNMIGKQYVKFGLDGMPYYVNYKGDNVPLKTVEVSLSDALHNGIGANGEEMNWWANPKIWNDAERFNLAPWNKKAIEEANDVGTSSSIVRYEPGETAPWYTQTAQMGSYMIADALGQLLTMGYGRAASTVIGVANAVASANGIGYQYEMGVFGENKQKNLSDLEAAAYGKAADNCIQRFYEQYNTDENFRQEADNYIKIRAQQLMHEGAALKAGVDGSVYSHPTADISKYEELAKEELLQQYSSSIIEEELSKIKQSDKYLGDMIEADETASTAASVAGTTDALKYSLVNLAGHRSWLFRKPDQATRGAMSSFMNNIREAAGKRAGNQGRRLAFKSAVSTAKSKAGKLGRLALGQAWGGGWTNWTDEMQAEGGRQINNDRFAAYLNNEYYGDASATAFSPYESYLTGAMRTPLKSNALNAFMVGALGSLLLMPSSSFLHTVGTKDGKSEFKERWKKDKVDAFSMLFTNGVLSEYAGFRDGERQVESVVDEVNKLIDKNDEFEVLKDAVSLNLAEADATNLQDKEILKFLKTLSVAHVLNSIDTESSTPSMFEEVAGKSSIIQEAKAMVDALVNNTLDDASAEELLKDWYAKNPSASRSEENDQKALDQIKKNANQLSEAFTTYEDVRKKIEAEEDRLGELFSPIVKYRLIQRQALNGLLEKRFEEEEEKLTGSTGAYYTSDALIPLTYGNEQARRVQLRANKNTLNHLSSEIDKAEEKVGTAEQSLNDFNARHRGQTKLNEADAEEKNNLEVELDNARMNLEYLQSLVQTIWHESYLLEESLNEKRGEEDEGDEKKEERKEKILSKDEILRLGASDRARMMSKYNRNNFSEEQKKEIEALEKELSLKDPALLEVIQSQGVLRRHIDANRSSYSWMIQHPYAAAVEVESKNNHFILSTINSINQRDGEALNNWVELLEKAPNLKEEDINELLFTMVKTRPADRLKYFTESEDAPAGMETLAKYRDTIERAKEWSSFSEKIARAINNTEGLDVVQKRLLKQSIDNIILQTKSREEAEQALQDAINDPNVNDNDRGMIADIMRKVGLAVSTERATVQGQQEGTNPPPPVSPSTPTSTNPVTVQRSGRYKAKELPSMTGKEARQAFGTSWTDTAPSEYVAREERKYLKATVDYLNNAISVEQYLAELGYTDSFIRKAETIVKQEADAKAEKYKPYIEDTTKASTNEVSKGTKYSAKSLSMTTKEELSKSFNHIFSDSLTFEEAKKVIESKINASVDYLNGVLTPKQYLEKLNFHSIDNLSESEVKEMAERQVSRFKPYINENKKRENTPDDIVGKRLKSLLDQFREGKTPTDLNTTAVLNNEEAILLNKILPNIILNGNYRGHEYSTGDIRYFLEVYTKRVLPALAKIDINNTTTPFASYTDYRKGKSRKIEKRFVKNTRDNVTHTTVEATVDGISATGINTFPFAIIQDKYTIDWEDYGIEAAEIRRISRVEVKELREADGGAAATIDVMIDGTMIRLEVALKPRQETTNNDIEQAGPEVMIDIDDTEEETMPPGYMDSLVASFGQQIGTEEAPIETTPPTQAPTETPDHVNSPDLQAQVEAANVNGSINSVLYEVTPDTTDEGNRLPEGGTDHLPGNIMYYFEIDSLKDDREEVKRKRTPGDKMDRYFKWFENAGIKLYEVIDLELKNIIKANPKIEFLFINPQKNATDDAALDDFAMLVVEYTNAVERVHKEERGGVVMANGKRYLIIGTAGFDKGMGKAEQGRMFRNNVLEKGKRNRNHYFSHNPSERFFVDPVMHTGVQKISSGRIVKKALTDGEVKIRKISELINGGESRNPANLALHDLKWIIQYNTKIATVNVSDRNIIHTPSEGLSNVGNTFLLIESANGEYSPVYMEPTMFSEIEDGKLKEEINKLLNLIASPDYNTRLTAVKQLMHWLYLSEDKNILIGKPGNSTISTVKLGKTQHTFDVSSSDFSVKKFIDAVIELNPRINLTVSNLMDRTSLQWLDEAGALRTDISKLTTSNASYTIHMIDSMGNPIITNIVESKSADLSVVNSDLEKANNKAQNSVRIGNISYRNKNGKWVDNVDREVTDPRMLEQIRLNNYIRANNLSPSLVEGESEYYIVDSDPRNTKVLKRNSNSSTVVELIGTAATTVIDRQREQQLEEQRREQAKRRLQEDMEFAAGRVPEGIEMGEEIPVYTEEDILAQLTGEPIATATPETPAPQPLQPEPINNNGATAATKVQSLAELQGREQPTDVSGLLRDRHFRMEIMNVLKEKGFTGKSVSEAVKAMQDAGIPVTGITDYKAWIDMIKNCRTL
ncbi:MAG: hypothetical protein IJU02_07065 [Lachnospiraceae bacterium]|nr:hypothetical protein [Lachnospiraceae bacterium]